METSAARDTRKDAYRRLGEQSSDLPLFLRAWWLDAVCGPDDWDVATVERGGAPIAWLPYYTRRQFGRTAILLPQLTQFMGPWLVYPEGQKYHTRLSFEKEMYTALIDLLPPHDSFTQNFSHAVTNWLPFYWRGFSQTTRYTYILDDIREPARTYGEFRSNVKTDIKKAARAVEVEESEDLAELRRATDHTFGRLGRSNPLLPEVIERIDAACKQRDCRKILLARDPRTRAVHAAVYLVWEETSAYYLMGGGDPKLRNSGATSLLVWEAIRFASTVTRKFDFEGSMLEPVERFFRAFGARQVPYSRISKSTESMRAWEYLARGFRKVFSRRDKPPSV